MLHLYKPAGDTELCFNIGAQRDLTQSELTLLRQVLADGFVATTVSDYSQMNGQVIEIGPRPNIETPWSSNAVSICHAVGLDMITRIECSQRHVLVDDDPAQYFADHGDRMTEQVYGDSLRTFDTGIVPEAVYDVELIEKGPDVLMEIPGISMDAKDRQMYYNYFALSQNRNPTIVEIMDLNNANSEHSRHGFFNAIQIIDDVRMEQTLFEMVRGALVQNPQDSIIAFKDNSSAIEGSRITTLIPDHPGQHSPFSLVEVEYHITLTAETHNHPTGVAPFPGAATGTGGRIRDNQATGRGSLVIAGTAGYYVGNLRIPGYVLPWEEEFSYPSKLATPLQIEIDASNGASDYGNKFGEPVIAGTTRSFGLRLPDDQRWEYVKPIMLTGGIGQMDARHTEKALAEKGMVIAQIGGPAYNVGFGGSAASSKMSGEQSEDLDFASVQRGNPEMEQKMNRVIRACVEMGMKTLSQSIHDQGAGGPANVLKELVEKAGGHINIRSINVADPTMSVLEIYVAEYQERCGLLINPEDVDKFVAICKREKVPYELLGKVTGDLKFVVHDSHNDSRPVDIDLPELLGNIPQKTFEDNRVDLGLQPVSLPEGLTVRNALDRVLRLMSVGSKQFLTNKVDRSVTGLIAQQQCVGPLQLPLSNVGIIAQSHFGLTGAATAIGEQPIKMIVDPAAGAEMAVGEALTNIMWAGGLSLEKLKCSSNWMWAPKLPGEGAAMWDACSAMCDVMKHLGIAPDGGKDSLSMAANVDDETVKSPRTLAISLYGAMPDITQVVTPDIKRPGESSLIYINAASHHKYRLGGSALAQVYGQVGDESPRIDDPQRLRNVFNVVRELIAKDLVLAGHDVSDGGLITTLLEMAFAGNCGFDCADLSDAVGLVSVLESPLDILFSEELGVVIECLNDDLAVVNDILISHGVNCRSSIGSTQRSPDIKVSHCGALVLDADMRELRDVWQETSCHLELRQTDATCVESERTANYDRNGPRYHIPAHVQKWQEGFTPIIADDVYRPKIAILREEGCNSDREMTSAFFQAGFDPWDVHMTDLLEGRASLDDSQGLVAVGGFSYADVLGSAKGWAATIMFNDRVRTQFDAFYERDNTFSLGVCNGCQLFAHLGWVPWKGISAEKQPRFVHNDSGRFESRYSTVRIMQNNAIMLADLAGTVFGIHSAHGEGKIIFPEPSLYDDVSVPMMFVDDCSMPTEQYPFNPNGSPGAIASLCSPDGRHLAMMPHPERAFLSWQCHWIPEEYQRYAVTPWMKMFHNAYAWCVENKKHK